MEYPLNSSKREALVDALVDIVIIVVISGVVAWGLVHFAPILATAVAA